ncbi:MAG: hypothetical protein F6J90_17515 [Moorea sp. SIOASIH]|uniref:hypothetical protein n=1 Tax=Moorena sp. SIOASIH TaxID=2607817 RepID=UPI0013BB339F|nr:hypothetical protein [Moorena sp. SIOASIH]NEO38029.1 hypothetical protein [Moorena sp. SIOASIH]
MRYTEFFPYSLFPIPYSLFPAPCSLLPKTQKFVPHPIENRYIMTIKEDHRVH